MNATLLEPHASLSAFGDEGSRRISAASALPRTGLEKRQVRSVENATHIAWWIGLSYVDGRASGSDSMEHFLKQVPYGLPEAVEQIKGTYFALLLDKSSRNTYAFTDGGGLFHAFHSSDGVSTSFLELAARLKAPLNELSPESLVEFFHFGYLSFEDTFLHSIKRLDPSQIACVTPSGKTTFIPKTTNGITELTTTGSFESLLRSFAASTCAERLSLDLTGGIDSRLIAVALAYFDVPFELAVRGTEDNEDVVIAAEVSKLLNRTLHVTHHETADFEESLPTLFSVGDGLFDVTRSHGPLQLQHDRIARGTTLMVGGVGGELFKDFWWLQDFPFYGKSKPNLSKLYSTRIVPVEPDHQYLSEPYAALSRGYRKRYLDRLIPFLVGGNTQTYDNIYYSVKMRDLIGRYLSNHLQFLQCYEPYLEPQMAAVGYRLPRTTRFFNRFHRQTITRYQPEVARLRTTEGGISVSAEALSISADVGKYVVDKVHRLLKKCGESLFHRRSFQLSPNDPGMFAAVRNCAATRQAFVDLQKRKIVKAGLPLQGVKDSYLGNIISLAMLFEYLEQNQSA